MICPYCKTANPETAKFCMNCGTSLAAGETGKPPKSQFLDQYLPQELVAKLEAARGRGAMAGERRVITMLFCDIKGSTAAAEKLDPEIWTDIMNGAFEHMIRPIYKYEGTVPRLMGDAILAFFGAPIAHEDDPQRAVLAALEIQSAIRVYAEEMKARHGIEFGARVGINTGLVVVGEIGSDLRMEYTAIGNAINLAARMEQTAAPGTVQITEETHKLIAPLFDFEELGGIEVKGKAEPVRAYRVLSVRQAPGQVRGLEGLSSPLVGREAQLSLLNDRLTQLAQGAGAFVTVIGEAGLGKSSLIAEAQRSGALPGLNWFRGEALSYARSISYFPWRQVIRQSIGVHAGESPEQVRDKLCYGCECCALPGGDIPFLEAMLAVESQESLKVVMNYQGEALVERVTEATRGYLCGLAGENPLALVLDDLHWADEASLNLLLRLSDLASEKPFLFICMLRPDLEPASWDYFQKIQHNVGERYHSIMLEPLPVEQTDVLLTNLLGAKELPETVRDLIVEKAQGNPFFVEELIRSLIDSKQLVRQNSHWRVSEGVATLSLPSTLNGVLGARIDRLPEDSRHVLQAAAVVGRSFDLPVLEDLCGPGEGLESQLRRLQETGLIQASESQQYEFRHVLIQEAAYDSVLMKRRRELHGRVGETLERLHAERLDELAPVLAHHFYHAQDERSLKYDVSAGEKAARLYANAEAATHFRRALEVGKRIRADGAQMADIFMQLGSVLELSGRYEQALANYDEMQSFAVEHEASPLELAALMAKATIYSTFTQMHNPELSQQMLIQALDISRKFGDRTAEARLNWNLMLNYLFSSRLDPALEHGERALGLARQVEDRESLAFVLNDLCRLYTCRGEFEKAYAMIGEARELWRALDNQVMLSDSFGSEAEARFNSGDHERALELLQEGLARSEKIENLWGQAYNRMLLSFVYFHRGEIGKAIKLSGRAIEKGDQGGLLATSTAHRADLAWYYGSYGAPERGMDLVTESLELTEAKMPAWRALPLAVKVRLHLLKGEPEAAKQAAGPVPLEPITIPYARYTAMVGLANVELALAQKDNGRALALSQDLVAKMAPLTRVDTPEVMRRNAQALSALDRLDEAFAVLSEARTLAGKIGSKHHLWSVLADLADVCSRMGKAKEARAFRRQARTVVEDIAVSLQEVGLREAFLERPPVRALMR